MVRRREELCRDPIRGEVGLASGTANDMGGTRRDTGSLVDLAADLAIPKRKPGPNMVYR